MFTLFLFYSMVTPKCDVEIEKKKSNVNTFTLLFHLFFVYFIQVLANVMCSHYFSFYSIITSQCVVEIEEHFSILLYGAFFGQAQLKLSWWYCQLIQPSTDPPSLSRILNVDCFQMRWFSMFQLRESLIKPQLTLSLVLLSSSLFCIFFFM